VELTDETKCPTCGGLGDNRSEGSGYIIRSVCNACNGSGKAAPPPSAGSEGPDERDPLPWKSDSYGWITDADGEHVAQTRERPKTAAFIVRAVNASHRPEPVNGNESALAHAERMHAENARLRAKSKAHRRELRRLNAVIRVNNQVMMAQAGQLLALQSASFKRPSLVGQGGVARERIERALRVLYYYRSPLVSARLTAALTGKQGSELLTIERAIDDLEELERTTPPAAEPVATGESEALWLLRELFGRIPESDLCERIEALLAKVGGGNG
jgi:hypothetical protein